MKGDGASGMDLAKIGADIREQFVHNHHVMSFGEYFSQFLSNPRPQLRSAAEYVRDVFDHYGQRPVRTARGEVQRFRLFDCDWDQGRDALVGHEDVQQRVYRVLGNFVREGRTNKLILLHGPNGSAKSTFVSCLMRAVEAYAKSEDGALYRFNWVFPSQKAQRGGGGIGFSERNYANAESYAHLEDELIDAKLFDELRDHPLLLLPSAHRRELFAQLSKELRTSVGADYLRFGELSPRNKRIYEALLVANQGDFLKVLRHVQVERFYPSRRYREALVTVEPQLSVDARTRQMTMDRSFSSLPSALQSVSLYEYQGELVDGNRGIVEFSDLLKRPLEAYKYLLGTVEQARVSLESAILYLDEIFIGSTNEGQLSVFKEIPEFQSFKGRLELVRVPYLLDYEAEEKIYANQRSVEAAGKHVAPHVTQVAALWAVLTRMRKPMPEKYSKGLADLVSKLSPLEKADLYAKGQAPDGWSPEQSRELIANIERIYGESDAYPNYEGRTGASPREVKVLLLNAGQSQRYACVSPLALFEELEDLVKNVSVYDFLKQEPLPGGYHEAKKFIYTVRERYLDIVEEEVRSSMGLVDEQQYAQLFERYINHVSHWVKKEKVRNEVTGRMEDADEELMSELEKTLGMAGKKDDLRHEIISRIGAWSLDNPNKKPNYAAVFPKHFSALRESYFEQRRKQLHKINQDLMAHLVAKEGTAPSRLDAEALSQVETTLTNLRERYGYCNNCIKDAVGLLLKKRFS